MDAVKKFSSHWPNGTVHFEFFSTTGSPKSQLIEQEFESVVDGTVGIGFQVQLTSTGAIFSVPNDKSIVQVLAENGIEIEVSCESGLCGTCVTRYVKGEVDHRDLVLEEDQQGEFFTPCCSRSKSKILVIDL